MNQRSSNPSIEKRIIKNLGEHGLLAMSKTVVRVRHKVAYIEGWVPNLTRKRHVSVITVQVEGVHEVVNMLRIAPMAVIDDDSLVKLIQSNLAENPRIDEARVWVEVLNGFVRLQGLVRTVAGKCIVEDEVWAACGVRGVTNEILVISDVSRDKIDVVEEITLGLCECLGLDPSDVDVSFGGGIVHLKGAVPNSYIKAAAEELVAWMPPVTEVVNDLEVIPPMALVEHSNVAEQGPTALEAEDSLPPKPTSLGTAGEMGKTGVNWK